VVNYLEPKFDCISMAFVEDWTYLTALIVSDKVILCFIYRIEIGGTENLVLAGLSPLHKND
jgi:hypothetical protein